eukprot:TRINITY_DN10217_c0_g1_i1.p1 TRINITY_DN10217_c0_g1~~TRINITY_DN10217_c0_g1_i1.p1  ORF type:complete len:118 (+),score=12.53 TRINITY_DN10217_c0_g1_i1:446-799(+)
MSVSVCFRKSKAVCKSSTSRPFGNGTSHLKGTTPTIPPKVKRHAAIVSDPSATPTLTLRPIADGPSPRDEPTQDGANKLVQAERSPLSAKRTEKEEFPTWRQLLRESSNAETVARNL